MWDLFVDGEYVGSYESKWDAVAAAASVPSGVDWIIVHTG